MESKQPYFEPPDAELERLMFVAASREQSLGYDYCREKGIGQQAVWNTYHGIKEEEWVQDQLPFGE